VAEKHRSCWTAADESKYVVDAVFEYCGDCAAGTQNLALS